MSYTLKELTALLGNGMAVYEHYYHKHTGRNLPRIGEKGKSPFLRSGRLEDNPSFSIYYHSSKGEVFFKDHGLDKKGSHWQFVMDLYGIDFLEAVNLIKREVLGITDKNDTVTKTYTPGFHEPQERKSTRTEIVPTYRNYSRQELSWFKSAGISPETLHVARVRPVAAYDLIKENKTLRIVPETSAFDIKFESGRHKIYSPFGDKRFKWTSNLIAEEDVFLFDRVPKECEHLFIVGGNRDAMSFLENVGHPVIALASESANMPEAIRSLIERYAQNIWVLYDNDTQGYRKAERFESEYGYRSLNHIYRNFKGTAPDGTAKDFVDFFQNNPIDGLEKFHFYLETNMRKL